MIVKGQSFRLLFRDPTAAGAGYSVAKNSGDAAGGTGTVTTGFVITGSYSYTMVVVPAGEVDTPGKLYISLYDSGGLEIETKDVDVVDPALLSVNLADGAITDAKITTPAEPTGPVTTILAMVQQVWRRFFKRSTRSSTQIKTYKNDGTTVVTTQTYTSSGTAEDLGAAT